MAKFQFDKKQLIPAVGMAVASAGLFTYFVLKMTTPPPLQAAIPTPKPGAQTASAQTGAASPNATAGTNAGVPNDPLAAIDSGLAAPTAGMRDPFAPGIIDRGGRVSSPPVQMASTKGIDTMPGIPRGLPSMGNVPPMGVPPGGGLPSMSIGPPPPQWTVTGVISESAEPQNRVAILRAGDVRRFVRLGDMVDGSFRLVDVSRSGVVLAQGARRIRLPLGGAPKKAGEKHTPIQSGAATGPWTGAPTSAPGQAQPDPGQAQPSPGQSGQADPAPAQQAPIQVPAQTPAAVPGPEQAAPTAGMY